ncbi:MAG TPA: Spy/CpxP family protein refolding chaperone [Verrucomicrobiae bacterium]
MKTLKYLVLAAAVAGGLLALNLQAQPTDKAERKGGKRPDTQARLNQMAEQLNLTSEQKEKVKPIMEAEREKMQGLRDLAPEQRREKMQEIRKDQEAKLKPILTPEQFEKWKKIRDQRGGKRGEKQEKK